MPGESAAPAIAQPGAASETTPPPSHRLTSAAEVTAAAERAIDGFVEDTPCRPWAVHLDELWFWENEVHWHPDSSVVFFNQGPLVFAAAVDGSQVELVADASAIERAHDVSGLRVYGPMTSFDVSPQGDLLVYSTCTYKDDTGRALGRERGYELATASVGGSDGQRLTTNARFDNYPSWSPDGTRIAFVAGRSTRYDVFNGATLGVIRADGSDWRNIGIAKHAVGFYPPQWSPDGSRLAVVGRRDDLKGDHAVFTLNSDGSDVQQLGRTASGPAWSPDGTRLAFAGPDRALGHQHMLFTMDPAGSEVQRVPLEDGWEPNYRGRHVTLAELNWIPTLAWSPAGDQLLYTCGLRICVVALDGTPVGRSPIEWPSGSVAAWSPDGTRIAVAAGAGAAWESPFVIDVIDPVLYTMAPDGTDVRLLAQYDAVGRFQGEEPQDGSGEASPAVCAAAVVPDPPANPGLVRDCETLLRVRDAFAVLLNWSADRPIRDWAGVSLGGSPPRVRELGLRNRGLRGPIPPALGQLTALMHLDLSGNFLTGPIPAELGQLPDLIEVSLAGNQFTGCVPPALPVVDREDLGLSNCEAGG